MSKTTPNPCVQCGCKNIARHWSNPDDHGLCIEYYCECPDCGRTSGFCSETEALVCWNTLSPEERIAELEKFIRKHSCERCDIRFVFGDECGKCDIYKILNGKNDET